MVLPRCEGCSDFSPSRTRATTPRPSPVSRGSTTWWIKSGPPACRWIFRIEGSARPLPPGVELAAYRIVQEALTNTLKHAGPASARVTVRYLAESVEVEIADSGAGPVASHPPGHGLVGMKERVALYGGTLEAGASEQGGYRVLARIPGRGDL